MDVGLQPSQHFGSDFRSAPELPREVSTSVNHALTRGRCGCRGPCPWVWRDGGADGELGIVGLDCRQWCRHRVRRGQGQIHPRRPSDDPGGLLNCCGAHPRRSRCAGPRPRQAQGRMRNPDGSRFGPAECMGEVGGVAVRACMQPSWRGLVDAVSTAGSAPQWRQFARGGLGFSGMCPRAERAALGADGKMRITRMLTVTSRPSRRLERARLRPLGRAGQGSCGSHAMCASGS
jgi:hypothetical protein